MCRPRASHTCESLRLQQQGDAGSPPSGRQNLAQGASPGNQAQAPVKLRKGRQNRGECPRRDLFFRPAGAPANQRPFWTQGWRPGLSRRAGSALRAFALAYQYVQKRAPVTDPLPPHVFAPTCGTCKRGAPRQLESPAIAHNWPALVFSSRRKGFEALILGADSMNSRVAIVRESARSALECGSLLPLSPPRRDQLAGRAAVCPVWAGEAASKLAGSKRQQAAALHSASDAGLFHNRCTIPQCDRFTGNRRHALFGASAICQRGRSPVGTSPVPAIEIVARSAPRTLR